MIGQHMTGSDWSKLIAVIKQELAGVTEADLAACAGRRDKLVEKFQEIYGISADEAEGAVMYYEHRIAMWYTSPPTQTMN